MKPKTVQEVLDAPGLSRTTRKELRQVLHDAEDAEVLRTQKGGCLAMLALCIGGLATFVTTATVLL